MRSVLVLVGVLTTGIAVHGAENSWTNTTGGKWETNAHWSLGIAPTGTQSAVFITNAPAKLVRIDSATAAASRTISNLTLGANSLRLSNAGTTTPLHILGAFTNDVGGVVTVSNSVLRVDGIHTHEFYNDGTVTLLNLGQLLLTNIFTSIGNATNASLIIRGGTARVGDLGVGALDVGTLTVSGGTLTLIGEDTSGLYVGDFDGSTGAVWITGGTVLLTNDATFVGFEGVGQFTVSNVTVLTSDFSVGTIGLGTLTVAGGTLNVSSLGFGTFIVGEFSGSTGAVWVTGGGRLLVPNDSTVIGGGGTGQLTVSNSTLSVSDPTIGKLGVGTLTLAGGTLTVATGVFEELEIGGFSESTGTVRVAGGQFLAGSVGTTIGADGSGEMIVNAGSVSSREVWVGAFLGSAGTLTMSGGTNTLSSSLCAGERAGASGQVWLKGGHLSVLNATTVLGSNGLGRLTMSNGTARLRDVVLGFHPGSAGSLTMAGGTMTALNGVTLGDCVAGGLGGLFVANGSLFITNSAKTSTLLVRNGPVMMSGGTLRADALVVTNACGLFMRTGGALFIGTTNLAPNLSAVGDGIFNSWKLQYRLDPFDPTVAAADTDGDGMSNLEEFLAGTVPTNAASAFRITGIVPEGNNLRITWTMGAGKTNALQRAASITGAYTNIFIITNTVGTVTNFLDVGAATNVLPRFYRVRLVP